MYPKKRHHLLHSWQTYYLEISPREFRENAPINSPSWLPGGPQVALLCVFHFWHHIKWDKRMITQRFNKAQKSPPSLAAIQQQLHPWYISFYCASPKGLWHHNKVIVTPFAAVLLFGSVSSLSGLKALSMLFHEMCIFNCDRSKQMSKPWNEVWINTNVSLN